MFCFTVGSPVVTVSHSIKSLQWLPTAYTVISSAFNVLSSIGPKPLFYKLHLSNSSSFPQISFALANACPILEANSLRFGFKSPLLPIWVFFGYLNAPGLNFLSRKKVAMGIKRDNKVDPSTKCLGHSGSPISTHSRAINHPPILLLCSSCVTYRLKHLPLCTTKLVPFKAQLICHLLHEGFPEIPHVTGLLLLLDPVSPGSCSWALDGKSALCSPYCKAILHLTTTFMDKPHVWFISLCSPQSCIWQEVGKYLLSKKNKFLEKRQEGVPSFED